jgi:hypothetical protein
MKGENMKTNNKKLTHKIITLIAAVMVAWVPIVCEAGTVEKAAPSLLKRCSNIPLSVFLQSQATTSQFFPPVRDYVGFTDAVDPETNSPKTFALIDYAGFANEYLTENTSSLGTKVSGSVIKCELANKKALITVTLYTTKALGFTQSIAAIIDQGFEAPTIFGAKAQDVKDGADPAVGGAFLFTTFVISSPDAALPNLVDVLNNNPASYAPVTLIFKSSIFGKCANGNQGYLVVDQAASTKGSNPLAYSKEIVKVSDSCYDTN